MEIQYNMISIRNYLDYNSSNDFNIRAIVLVSGCCLCADAQPTIHLNRKS